MTELHALATGVRRATGGNQAHCRAFGGPILLHLKDTAWSAVNSHVAAGPGAKKKRTNAFNA